MTKSANSVSFKVKDCFTLLSLIAALYSVILSIQGEIEQGSFFILLAWLLDGLDGFVAKLTKSANQFGSNFDNLVDLFGFTIAPAFVIYASFVDYSDILAICLCFFIISIGTIRLAKFQTKPLHIPGYWIGFPRPASGLFIIFLLNSSLFLDFEPYLIAALLIIPVGFLGLTYLPYKSNKAKFTKFQIFIIFLAPISSILLFTYGYMWDLAFFWMIAYLLQPWIGVRKTDREEIRERVREWKGRE
jgi:CDP-diacylglycerol--serine O-phosphatidyltransferase